MAAAAAPPPNPAVCNATGLSKSFDCALTDCGRMDQDRLVQCHVRWQHGEILRQGTAKTAFIPHYHTQ